MKAREMAFLILRDTADKKAYTNIALTKAFRQHELSNADRRLVTELVYGVLKQQNRLDFILSSFAKKPLKKLHPAILIILRLGVYQILELTRIPDSAACNESVKLAKKYSYTSGSSLVNGLLRNIIRQRGELPQPNPDKPVDFLSITYSHPVWLIKLWLKRYGFAETELLCQANNETPPLCLRTNTLKTTRLALMQRLEQEGVSLQPSECTEEGILCIDFPALNQLTSLQEGFSQVQDESSMLVAPVLSPKPGETILDLCAAPGGKTTHLAALMKNEGKIKAFDLFAHKIDLIKENAQRLGIQIIDAELQNSLNLPESLYNTFDRVLADVPCSGLGVLRRKPDARWHKQEKDLQELPELQYQLLVQGSRCLKQGGILVYSTCTIEPAENQSVVDKFLANHPNYEAVSLDTEVISLPPFLNPYGQQKFLQILPHKHHMDGFFLAKLRRKS